MRLPYSGLLSLSTGEGRIGAGACRAAPAVLQDWANTAVVELTPEVCEAAAQLAEVTGARSLDAPHLGAAKVVGAGALPIVTFDLRQAQAARSLGWVALGS